MSTPNCTLDVWENKNYGDGGHHQFTGPHNTAQLNNNYWDGYKESNKNEMDDCISSLKTGSQAWAKVFSGSNFTGAMQLILPSTNISDLSTIGMDNTIGSIQLFDAYPVDTDNVLSKFLALYPGSTGVNKTSGMCIEFYAQDAKYRIYYPTMVQSGNIVSFTIQLDHEISAGKDDHATVTFAMDTQGYFSDQIKISYDMNDTGAYQIPDWVIKIVDKGIDAAADEAMEICDGAEIVLTAGAGVELVIPTDIAIEVGAQLLTFGVDHINTVIEKLFGLSDDGGTMYFSAVPSHAIVRLIYAYMQELYGASSGQLVRFDGSAFLSYFGKSWSDGKNNPYFNFTNGGKNYRSYYPDNSSGYSKMGLLSSVKIDAINDNDKDDHLVLVTTFDSRGKLFSVQGSIDIYGAPDDDDDEDDYIAPSTGTICYDKNGHVVSVTKDSITPLSNYTTVEAAWKDQMQTALNNVGYVDHNNFSAALNNLVNAAYQVLMGTEAAIYIQ